MKTLSFSPALMSAMATRRSLSQSPDAIRQNEKQLRNGNFDRRVGRSPLCVKPGHSAMSAQCPVCQKADTAGPQTAARGLIEKRGGDRRFASVSWKIAIL